LPCEVTCRPRRDPSRPPRALWVLASDVVDLEQLGRELRKRLNALGPAPRAELLHVLMLPDLDLAEAMGSYWGNPNLPP
jgi:hypothetical protein